MPFSEEIIGALTMILELEGPMVCLPVLLDRLEEDQGIPAAIPQLVLRKGRISADGGGHG
jgi:hypothetical protein